MKMINTHYAMIEKQDIAAKEAVGYAEMSDKERSIYDQINLVFAKQRDEADNAFDKKELEEMTEEDYINMSKEEQNAWKRAMLD